jgi:small GTP-binding protein
MRKDDEEFDLNLKIIIVGDTSVGKSNIGTRYIDDKFSIETKATVGVEFFTKNIVINKCKIRAHIWDTAGQEKFRAITKSYYRGAKGAFVVFDLTRRETFNNTDKWISELKSNGENDLIIILLGNKSDLVMDRCISKEEAQEKAHFFSI